MDQPSRRVRASQDRLAIIDQVCDAFEAAWKAGVRPQPEDYLGDVPERHRETLLRELRALEQAYRTSGGKAPPLAFRDGAGAMSTYATVTPRLGAGPGDHHSIATPSTAETSAGEPSSSADTDRMDTFESVLSPPCGPDEIGRLGPYRVLKLLDSGGMGLLFLAEDQQLERCVALKVMKPNLATSPEARQRFLREARSAAALRHDNIVTIYNVGEDHGTLWLAMELLEGETLHHRLQATERLSVIEAAQIGRQVAEALTASHRRGLVHRDIKPANIWLEAPSGRVKVLDFGLVRPAARDTQLTDSGVVVGTPAYMAPEQARGIDVDHRSDLFSLGCVLFRALTGQMPFPGKDAMGILLSLVEHTPAHASELTPGVPAALDELIAGLLAKSPSARPQTAAEVAQSLASIERELAPATLVGQSTLRIGPESAPTMVAPRALGSPSAGPEPPDGGRARRWRHWAVGGAVTAVLLAAVGVAVSIRTSQRPKGNHAVDVVPSLTRYADRAAAEWVLGLGGKVKIGSGAEQSSREITSLDNLPDEPFQVRDVNVSNRSIKMHGDMSAIMDLKELKGLQLDDTDFSDADLQAIANLLPTLESFRLSRTRVTLDAFAVYVRRMTILQQLMPPDGVEDVHLPLLGELPRLERLELTSTSVTGGAILANLPRLKVLMIRKGTLSDADLQEICRLPDVERLELVQTGVTDAGVEHIRNTRIWKLTLQNYLSDAALLHLRNHPTLREIDIHTKNSLTAAAVASLRESLPDCKVIWADSAKPSVSKSAD